MKTSLLFIGAFFLILSSCVEEASDSEPSIEIGTAESVSFTDIDLGSGEVAGYVKITKASDESNITHYALYWGSSTSEKIGTNPLISEFVVTGSDVTGSLPPDTTIPTNASHLLLYTKNQTVESSNSVSVAISDRTETEYITTEGIVSAPIDLSADTYIKEIGQGKSYYSFAPLYSNAVITIYDLSDDLDIIRYTDASYDSTPDASSTRGRLVRENIYWWNGTKAFFVIDGTKTGHKLNGKGSTFTMTLASHSGEEVSGVYENEFTSGAPKPITDQINEKFYYDGQTGGGTSYYTSSVTVGQAYNVNVPDASNDESVFSDLFSTEVTVPYAPTDESIFISVTGSGSGGRYKLELVTAEGSKTFPVYLFTGRNNYSQVNNSSSYYSFDVTQGKEYTATVTNLLTGNDVDLYVFNDSSFSSSAGSSTEPNTTDESLIFEALSDTVTIRIDDRSGNGASFILKLTEN